VTQDYDVFDDPYCYKGTFVLKNKLGARDPDTLEAFELEMSTLRAEEPLPDGRFDPRHYRAVHRHLFQDVYRWAGKYRTVRTAKDRSVFCYPENIESEMERLFLTLSAEAFAKGSNFDRFVAAAAEFLAELNAIHPFREGNGRTQLSFLYLLGVRAGWSLDMTKVRAGPFMEAMVRSFAGDLEPLRGEIACLRA
jgi:cell filamentation protein